MESMQAIATAGEAVKNSVWSDRVGFRGGALAPPTRSGAVLPGGAARGRAMARLTRGTRIVELGPGSGSITRHLLDGLPRDGRILAIELDPGIAVHLQQGIRDPRLVVQIGDAASLNRRMGVMGWEAADSIVSAIPFQALGEVARDEILSSVQDSLASGGRFIAFQYGLRLLPSFRRHFRRVRVIGPIWRNLPPAFVIIGQPCLNEYPEVP